MLNGSGSSDRWRTVGPTIFEPKAQSEHMFAQQGLVHMFGEHIAGIVGSQNLLKCEVTFSDAILHPEICGCQVSHFPKATPTGDANGSSGIRHDAQLQVDT